MAAIRALESAAELGLRVVVEGDSSIVMTGLKTKDPGLASYGLLVLDTCIFENLFSELSYSHTKREGIEVAHYLAKLAISYPNSVIYTRTRISSKHICNNYCKQGQVSIK